MTTGGDARSSRPSARSRSGTALLRSLWVVVATWATLAASFALEPLIALGPSVVVLMNPPFVGFTVVALLGLAVFRLGLAAFRWARRSMANRLADRHGPPADG